MYPIRVVTEATIPPKELVIQTICRKKKEKKFYVELPGIKTLSVEDKFDVRITQLRTTGLNVMNSWLKIMHNQTEVDPQRNILYFVAKFNPYKPFRDTGILTVSRQLGGIWR